MAEDFGTKENTEKLTGQQTGTNSEFFGIGEKVNDNIDKLGIERPISKENLEVGKKVPEEVIEHILTNNFFVKNPKFIKCVDGRTPEDNIKGIYMPGGTDGLLDLVFNLLTQYNIDVNPKEVRDILVDVIGGEENYYYHSDEHSYEDSEACGCGHDNLVLNNPEHKVNLAPKYANFIKEQRRLNKEKMEILEGDHEEKGVILVDIDDISIVPKGSEASFFVYNQKDTQKILREFISKINEKLNIDIDINKALRELDEEALSTFGILGGEAPHYRLNFVDGKIKIEFDGPVETVIQNYYLGE